ncbi:glycosyl transferase [Undibacter mobilis]|uniref:Glycosyl transferase n=1 Tax=Undibacter mobilis TaxID=2292256 RepID=A0A371B413_9BRAD|nr:glycosyl transferase [Undibacter mobilis]RDV02328.1 glycosyl transferase [Undibacter mobilis]
MLSVIVATHESERALVPTLSALVPGAMSGLVSEVVVADAGSKDATAEVADIAGCRFIASGAPLGERLRTAALSTRTPWLMFLRAGVVLDADWTAASETFMQTASFNEAAPRAAVFRAAATTSAQPGFGDVIALVRAVFAGRRPSPDQGLVVARNLYDAVGGHPAHADAEAALLGQLGRKVALLGAGARRVI